MTYSATPNKPPQGDRALAIIGATTTTTIGGGGSDAADDAMEQDPSWKFVSHKGISLATLGFASVVLFVTIMVGAFQTHGESYLSSYGMNITSWVFFGIHAAAAVLCYDNALCMGVNLVAAGLFFFAQYQFKQVELLTTAQQLDILQRRMWGFILMLVASAWVAIPNMLRYWGSIREAVYIKKVTKTWAVVISLWDYPFQDHVGLFRRYWDKTITIPSTVTNDIARNALTSKWSPDSGAAACSCDECVRSGFNNRQNFSRGLPTHTCSMCETLPIEKRPRFCNSHADIRSRISHNSDAHTY